MRRPLVILAVACLAAAVLLTGVSLAQKLPSDAKPPSATPAMPAVTPAGHLIVPTVIAPGQPLVIRWRNTPGNPKDWVTVVPAGTPDNKWGRWTYLRGRTSGVFIVRGLRRGQYEVRLYYDWPRGRFNVIERKPVTVGRMGAGPPDSPPAVAPGGPIRSTYLSMPSSVFRYGTTVVVIWNNTPGNPKDWVTIVPQGTSVRKWGRWTYLRGRTRGAFRVRGLRRGHYQARLYFNWPRGGFRVRDRLNFQVK